MDYRSLFSGVRRHPNMYGLDGSYREAVAFVVGCDAGNAGRVLAGFRDWLDGRLGERTNLAWPELVLRVAFPGESVGHRDMAGVGEERDRRARDRLFDLIDEFLAERGGDA